MGASQTTQMCLQSLKREQIDTVSILYPKLLVNPITANSFPQLAPTTTVGQASLPKVFMGQDTKTPDSVLSVVEFAKVKLVLEEFLLSMFSLSLLASLTNKQIELTQVREEQ